VVSLSSIQEKPSVAEKPALKASETTTDPEVLRKVKNALQCTTHPGPHWWCCVRHDKGHEGEHVALGIHEVDLWARKIMSDLQL
jgi:hypothetical protein